MRGGFLYLDTPSFMAPKVRQKARCHSCGVKGEQLRNQAAKSNMFATTRRRAGAWLKYVRMVNIVGVKVGVNLIPIKLINYNQHLEWVEWRTEEDSNPRPPDS